MRRIRMLLPAMSLAVATVVGVGPDTASAHESGSSEVGDATPRADGEFQRPAGAIPLAPGVDLLPPPDGGAGVMHDGDNVTGRGCPNYHLCVWRDIDFGWYGIGFYHCWTFNLADWGFPPNHPVGVSSFANSQSTGTWSYFYDSTGEFLMSSMAPDLVPWVGPGRNDLAATVKVC